MIMHFGAYNPSSILSKGEWTFTYYMSELLFIAPEQLREQLRQQMVNLGVVTNVKRAFTSDNYAITILLNNNYYHRDVLAAFEHSWGNIDLGEAKPSYVTTDKGKATSQPGRGLPGVVVDVSKKALDVLPKLPSITAISTVIGIIAALGISIFAWQRGKRK